MTGLADPGEDRGCAYIDSPVIPAAWAELRMIPTPQWSSYQMPKLTVHFAKECSGRKSREVHLATVLST